METISNDFVLNMKMSIFREAVVQVVNVMGSDTSHDEIREISENMIIKLASDIIEKREYLGGR